MIKLNRTKNGLTLVELLVVMGVLAIFGTLLVTIFTRTLRGTNKSQIIGIIKQNGQSVLETIDKTVRNSDNIVCVSSNSTSLIMVQNGIYTRYRFIPESTSNGLVQQDNPVKAVIAGREETETEFVNKVCADADPMQNANVLTDTNSQTGTSVIPVNGLPFVVRNKQAGYKDIITIQFALKPGIGAPNIVAGQIDPVTFETTIQLR